MYIALTVAFCIMVLTDLVGNSMVILVVLLNKSMRTPMNQLLLNLALADIVVAIFIAVQFVIGPMYEHPAGTAGSFLCKFITGGTMTWTAAVTSVCNLIAISAERYYAVVKPLSSLSHFTTSKLKIIIPGCWILGFLWNTPLFLTVTYRSDLQTCGEKWPNTILPKIYSFGWNIVAGVIPVTVMTWFYFRVVRELWFKKTPAMQCNSTNMVLQSRKKATLSVITVSVIYVICWTPGLVMYFLAYMLPNQSVHNVVHQITIFLATFNSSVNPIVYSFSSARFRKHLIKLVKCSGSVKVQNNRLLGFLSSNLTPPSTSDSTCGNSSKVNLGFRRDEEYKARGATDSLPPADESSSLKTDETRL